MYIRHPIFDIDGFECSLAFLLLFSYLYDFGIIGRDFSYFSSCDFISVVNICCNHMLLMAQISERWYVRRQKRLVALWPI